MSCEVCENLLADFFDDQGDFVIRHNGVAWREFSGFMMPAYLPGLCPPIDPESAAEVLRRSGKPFLRWDEHFGQVQHSQWWNITRRGPWSIDDVKDKKKRWMIRQGRKNFTVRHLTAKEVLGLCPSVARMAASRYKGRAEVEDLAVFEKRIAAGERNPGVIEYIGCFYGDELASFSENYIQSNSVFLSTIRHHPGFLNKYSSYGLLEGVLDYYLNHKHMDQVIDGCRSIYHQTGFQDHLVKVFGFVREYAALNVLYRPWFWCVVQMGYPLNRLAGQLSSWYDSDLLDKVSSILLQEKIRRSCRHLHF